MRKESAREADLALRADAKSPDAYLAREMLLPETAWAKREELLLQGIAVDPQWPHTNGFLAKLLMEMGRVQEAQAYAARAAAADLQIDWRPMAADLSCGAGRFDENIAFLEAQLVERPSSSQVRGTLANCLVQQGRFDDARAKVAEGGPAWMPLWKAEFDWWKARTARTPANLAEARSGLLALAQTGSQGNKRAIEGLSALGFLDDAFGALSRYTPTGPTTGGEGALLFYPQMDPLRRDPRFMQYAGRVGLGAYWKASGKWPDYCAAPDLPYNCRTEAERWIER
jgi:tetratricopeptide (TPR) repeat protein